MFIACSTDPPEIIIAPRDQRVADNGVISFLCRATGNPPPEIQWRRTGSGNANSRRSTYTANGNNGFVGGPSSSGSGSSRQQSRFSVVAVPPPVRDGAGNGAGSGSVFRIEPVKAARGDDDSEIECVADNGIGDPAVVSARLHVYPADEQGIYDVAMSDYFFTLPGLYQKKCRAPVSHDGNFKELPARLANL